MGADDGRGVLYWDASAVLSALVADDHTTEARRKLGAEGFHLVSTLAFAEVLAVLARLEREASSRGRSTGGDLPVVRLGFVRGPWRWTAVSPEIGLCESLSTRHPLRGANLWHLATAVTLKRELPALRMLTYDSALRSAARLEGL